MARRERVTMDDKGHFVMPPAVLADLEQLYGQRVDVAAEIINAEAWCASNLRRRAGVDMLPTLAVWLRRAADDARQSGPTLTAIDGGAQVPAKGCAVLALVAGTTVTGRPRSG